MRRAAEREKMAMRSMRAEHAVSLPNKTSDPNGRSFLSNCEMAGALHDSLRYHVPDFFLDDTNENHPLQPCKQRVDVVAVYSERLMEMSGVRERSQRRGIAMNYGLNAGHGISV